MFTLCEFGVDEVVTFLALLPNPRHDHTVTPGLETDCARALDDLTAHEDPQLKLGGKHSQLYYTIK